MKTLREPDTPNTEKRSLGNLVVCLVNQAAQMQWFSRDPMGYTGAQIFDKIMEEDHEIVTSCLSRCLFHGETVDFEARGVGKPTGEVLPWAVRMWPIKDVTGLAAVAIGQSLPSSYREIKDDARQILGLLADDHTLKQIAEKMFLSESTIDTKMRQLKAKLGVSNIGGLVARAIMSGLI